MKEVGKVIKLDSARNTATVQFDRKTACDKCNMCMMSKDKMKVELVFNNSMNAKLDDRVEVIMGDGFVLTSAVIVYLIPVLLVGLSLFFTRNLNELIQFIFIGVSLLLGIFIAVIADKKIRNRKGFSPEIINILEKSKEETENDK